MSNADMFYVAEDPDQPGATFAAMTADGRFPGSDARTLAKWVRRGARVKLVNGLTMRQMLEAWNRPEGRQ